MLARGRGRGSGAIFTRKSCTEIFIGIYRADLEKSTLIACYKGATARSISAGQSLARPMADVETSKPVRGGGYGTGIAA